MIFQKTLKSSVTITGIGLHSGRPVQISMKPAMPNHGVRFVRTDLEGTAPIPAHYEYVINTQMATTLGLGNAKVSTVEHLMAALQGMGIDNVLVEVDGPEIPIMDGSSARFAEAIASVGTRVQHQPRPFLALRRKVELRVGEKWAVAEPSKRLEIHATIEWDHPAIGFQEYTYVEGKTPFEEIASARTFGFLRDYEALKRMGLARGGSLESAVVMDDARVINPEGLRFTDEFARHKVLDALGDLKLAGVHVNAYIRLHRAGHDLHSQLLAAIFKDPSNYEIINTASDDQSQDMAIVMAGVLARKIASAAV